MDEIRKALQELADDPNVPEVTQKDVDELEQSLRATSDRSGTKAAAIDVGPKTICVIKCAVKWGICKAKGGKDCNTAFAECVAECYIR